MFHRIFCILRNWLSFQNPQTLSRKKQSLHHEKDYHRVRRWIFLLNSLHGWDFSSHTSAHGPGEDPFEAVMCTVGAASQISWMLTEDICFWHKISLKSPQEFNQTKYFMKRYTVVRFCLTFQNWKHFLSVLTTETFYWNKFIRFFLECCYRPVGGSL